MELCIVIAGIITIITVTVIIAVVACFIAFRFMARKQSKILDTADGNIFIASKLEG